MDTREKGVPSSKITRAYRSKVIPSRMLWCVPTSGQPGILYLLHKKRCLVYWLLLINVFLWYNLCFYWIQLFEWASSQWSQLKGLQYLVTRTAILNWSWQRLEEEGSGSSFCPPPLIVVVTHICMCTFSIGQIYLYIDIAMHRGTDKWHLY